MFSQFGRRFSSAPGPVEDRTFWGPLLITFAPLCSGKTSFLGNLGETVETISPQTVPTAYTRQSVQILVNFSPDSEMRLLVMLYLNMISVGEFKERLLRLIPDTIIREELQTVALQLYNSDEHDFKLLDVFHLDTASMGTSMSVALKHVKRALKKQSTVVAWDNALVVHGSEALHEVLAMAEKYHRVVRFVRWSHEIPVTTFRQLLHRNLCNFLATGKYWDASLVYASMKFVEGFVTMTEQTNAVVNGEKEYASRRMSHSLLVSVLAKGWMDEQGYVSTSHPPQQQSSLAMPSVDEDDSSSQGQVSADNQSLRTKKSSFRYFLSLSSSSSASSTSSGSTSNASRTTSTDRLSGTYHWFPWLSPEAVIGPIRTMAKGGSHSHNSSNNSLRNSSDTWRTMYGMTDADHKGMHASSDEVLQIDVKHLSGDDHDNFDEEEDEEEHKEDAPHIRGQLKHTAHAEHPPSMNATAHTTTATVPPISSSMSSSPPLPLSMYMSPDARHTPSASYSHPSHPQLHPMEKPHVLPLHQALLGASGISSSGGSVSDTGSSQNSSPFPLLHPLPASQMMHHTPERQNTALDNKTQSSSLSSKSSAAEQLDSIDRLIFGGSASPGMDNMNSNRAFGSAAAVNTLLLGEHSSGSEAGASETGNPMMSERQSSLSSASTVAVGMTSEIDGGHSTHTHHHPPAGSFGMLHLTDSSLPDDLKSVGLSSSDGVNSQSESVMSASIPLVPGLPAPPRRHHSPPNSVDDRMDQERDEDRIGLNQEYADRVRGQKRKAKKRNKKVGRDGMMEEEMDEKAGGWRCLHCCTMN